MSAAVPSRSTAVDAAAAPSVPSAEQHDAAPSLFSLFNAPSRAQYDNSAVRRRLSGHTRRSSANCRKLESFASKKFPFSFFNTEDTDEDAEERVHPLFAAVALGSTQDVVRVLYEACPKSLGETTRAGLTPLHVAAKYGASVGVVEFLLHHCPSHASRKSKSTWSTPLHLAAANGGSAEVIRCLVVGSHGALKEADRRGNTPLHCAALSRSSPSNKDEAIRLLVAFRRSALEQTNNSGMTPIHCACLSNSSPASIRTMVDKSPSGRREAAIAADSHGNVALHYASSHGSAASVETVRTLLEADPSRSALKNKTGHTPLDVAAFDSSTPRTVLVSIKYAVRLTELSDDGDAADLHSSMTARGWHAGADMALDARPGLVHVLPGLDLDAAGTVLFPEVARKFERRRPEGNGGLAAVFELVRGAPHLVGR